MVRIFLTMGIPYLPFYKPAFISGFSFKMLISISNPCLKMLQYIYELYNRIIEHYAAMSIFVFIIAMLKLSIPLVAFVVNRISEYRSYKALMELGIFTDEQARERAREIWRPKSKTSKWLNKIIKKFTKSH